MRSMPKSLVLLAALGCVVALPVAAQVRWKTLSLAGRSDFTVDIPAVSTRLPASSDDELMNFYVTNEAQGGDKLECILMRRRYASEATHRALLDTFAAGKSTFCDAQGAAGDWSLLESKTLKSNGLPAARCRSSYTDEKSHGVVQSMLVVAGSRSAYFMQCLFVNDTDKASAEHHYDQVGKQIVTRVQTSLHLPPSAK